MRAAHARLVTRFDEVAAIEFPHLHPYGVCTYLVVEPLIHYRSNDMLDPREESHQSTRRPFAGAGADIRCESARAPSHQLLPRSAPPPYVATCACSPQVSLRSTPKIEAISAYRVLAKPIDAYRQEPHISDPSANPSGPPRCMPPPCAGRRTSN